MEPQFDKSPAPGLALPQPRVEQGVVYAPESGLSNPEVMPPQPSQVQYSVASPVAAGAVPMPIAQPLPSVDGAAAVPTDGGDDATDLDKQLIEKAKAIVERTKADPYVESSEISKAKAEYLRVRYNKHIKLAEEQVK